MIQWRLWSESVYIVRCRVNSDLSSELVEIEDHDFVPDIQEKMYSE
jgi:hypothetical protein